MAASGGLSPSLSPSPALPTTDHHRPWRRQAVCLRPCALRRRPPAAGPVWPAAVWRCCRTRCGRTSGMWWRRYGAPAWPPPPPPWEGSGPPRQSRAPVRRTVLDRHLRVDVEAGVGGASCRGRRSSSGETEEVERVAVDAGVGVGVATCTGGIRGDGATVPVVPFRSNFQLTPIWWCMKRSSQF